MTERNRRRRELPRIERVLLLPGPLPCHPSREKQGTINHGKKGEKRKTKRLRPIRALSIHQYQIKKKNKGRKTEKKRSSPKETVSVLSQGKRDQQTTTYIRGDISTSILLDEEGILAWGIRGEFQGTIYLDGGKKMVDPSQGILLSWGIPLRKGGRRLPASFLYGGGGKGVLFGIPLNS